MRGAGVSPQKVVVVGDSGGDGPHFEWGAALGATLVGSMTKWSLETYCRDRGIRIHEHFGLVYGEGENRDPGKEKTVDFMGLVRIIEEIL
jgi:hypothetical protein